MVFNIPKLIDISCVYYDVLCIAFWDTSVFNSSDSSFICLLQCVKLWVSACIYLLPIRYYFHICPFTLQTLYFLGCLLCRIFSWWSSTLLFPALLVSYRSNHCQIWYHGAFSSSFLQEALMSTLTSKCLTYCQWLF